MGNYFKRLADILALRPAPGLTRDSFFLIFLAGGIAVAVALGSVAPAHAQPGILAALFSVLLYQPLIEELLFRGVVQGELLRRAWARPRLAGISVANGLASLAFAGMHLVHHGSLWAAAVFLPSLVFGIARERSNSVIPALILHVAFNAGYFGAGLLATGWKAGAG